MARISVNKIKTFLKDSDYRFSVLNFMGFYNRLSDEKFLKKKFKISVGYDLNLDNPRSFNEKLQWLKIHDRKPIYTTMVDKYEVKQYVADRIGEQYVIPTYGVWDKFDNIDFDSLPDQFVLKCTHDSGGVVVCKDKATFDKKKAKQKLNKCLKRNYYWVGREWPYKYVEPRIIAEEYLEDNEKHGVNNDLADYKVWCFNGDPKYIWHITGRYTNQPVEKVYNTKWEEQTFTHHNLPSNETKPKPKCLEELLLLSKKLANGLYFARIDFYVPNDDEIKFGEITFYPMSGFECFHPEKVDYDFGQLLKIPVDFAE